MKDEERELAREWGLNVDSPTTEELVRNRLMSVDDFIGSFRLATIRRTFPSEHLDETVEQAFEGANTTVRKLLIDSRWRK
jgi:hypothetical protein